MSYRALLTGGPLDGVALNLAFPAGAADTWPPAIGDSEREAPGHYALAEAEPVPFALGEHPNVLLTATYRWEPDQ